MRNEKDGLAGVNRRYVKAIVLLLLLFLVTFILPAADKLTADDINFEHQSNEDGLSQSSVFCIFKDSKGFMWFGTQNGLNRYDSHNFKIYDFIPQKNKSLILNYVTAITENPDGILWIGTRGGGLNKFYVINETFEIYKHKYSDPNSLSDDNIHTIFRDNGGILWIGTNKGLNKFNTKDGKIIRYLENSSIEGKTGDNRVNTICRDNSGTLWVGSDDGLHKYKRDKGSFIPIDCKKKESQKDASPIKIKVIYIEKDNVSWIGTDMGLYKFKLEDGKFIHDHTADVKLADLKDKQITSIYRDSSGRLWVGTLGNGIYLFDTSLKMIRNITYDKDDMYSLSHNEIFSIGDFETDFVWVGTNGGGINIFDSKRKKFDLYNNIPGCNDIMAICTCKNGGIFVGTFVDGLKKFDCDLKEIITYKITDTVSKDSDRNKIIALCEDHTGIVWVGTDGAGLYEFYPGTGQFVRYKKVRDEENILEIFEDSSNVLWVGSLDSGLIKIDRDRKNMKPYKNEPDNPGSLSNNRVNSIFEDNDGNLWVGTGRGGLNKFNRKTGIFTRFEPDSQNPDSIKHNFIVTIFQDSKDTLWIGTSGGGLNKFDKGNGKFTAFTEKNGLPNNVIYAVLEDRDGNLWLSTNKGLSKFDLKTQQFRNYTPRDGLQGYEFNSRVACKIEKQGKELMLFGGINGLNSFCPEEMKDKYRLTSSPPIVFTFFKTPKREVNLPDSIQKKEGGLKLSYREIPVSFEFAALNFADPARNMYAYKLEPVNKDWIDLGNKHSFDLINLEPGDYIFRVKGSNNDGAWNKDGTSLKIKVNPPFWRTWWFYVLLSSFVGGFILYLFRMNLQLKKEIDERNKAEKLNKTLVDTSPDAITLCELESEKIIKIAKANRMAANLLGYDSEEEIQTEVKTIFDIFSENDRDRLKVNIEEIKKSGFKLNTEYTVLSKTGNPIAVEISTSLIRDTDGAPKYLLSVTRDIRQRKEAEKQERLQQEKLVQVDKMVSLGTLVSNVAHELNNPVASIKMNADIFSKVWTDAVPVLDKHNRDNPDFKVANLPYKLSKPRLEKLVKGLIESGERIEKIIKDLRDYSRPDECYSKQYIDINRVIQSSIDLNEHAIDKATKNFKFKPANNLHPVEGNFQRLEQVFINLIQNACQALTDDSKKIEIATVYDKKKNQIVITIEDEGIGIEEENLKKIGEPFFTTKREKEGTGLGLSISMRIIRDHGGNTSFESQAGKGTTFTVNLPAIESEKNEFKK